AATGVERKIQPRRLSREKLPQRRSANVGGLRILKHRRPHELGADRFADDRSRAVTTDQIDAVDRGRLSTIEVAGNGRYTVFVLSEFIDFGAIHDANARLRSHVRERHRFEELLVDP